MQIISHYLLLLRKDLMAINCKHLINKQSVNVYATPQEGLHYIAIQLNKLCQNKLISALNEVCDSFSRDDEVIQLGKIKLNIGDINQNALADEFVEKIKLAFADMLSKQIPILSNSQKVKDSNLSTPFLQTGKLAQDSLDASIHGHDGQDRCVQIKDIECELVESYLLNGSIPLWVEGQPNLQAIVSKMLQEKPEKLMVIVDAHARKLAVRRRLVCLLTDKQLFCVMKTLDTTFRQDFIKPFLCLNRINKKLPISFQQLREIIWGNILFYLVDNKKPFKHSKIWQELMYELADKIHIAIPKLQRYIIRQAKLLISISSVRKEFFSTIKITPAVINSENLAKITNIQQDSSVVMLSQRSIDLSASGFLGSAATNRRMPAAKKSKWETRFISDNIT